MADATKKLSVRLSVEGAQQAKADLQAFGKIGDESMNRVRGGARETSMALDAFGRSANDNSRRFSQIGGAFDDVDRKIKGGLRGLNDVRGAIDLIAPGAGAASQGLGRLAVVIGNVADAAGVLSSVFLRNPLGLAALAIAGAATAYLTLRDNVNKAAVAESAYQKAIDATGSIIDQVTDKTKMLASERSRAAREAADAAIAETEAWITVLEARRDALAPKLEEATQQAALGRYAGDVDKLRDMFNNVEAEIGSANVRLFELRTRIDASTVSSIELRTALNDVKAELGSVGRVEPTGVAKLTAEFERVKAVLDAGLKEGLGLTADEYQRLLSIAANRRDIGIATILEEEAARVSAANEEIFRSLQEVIDRTNAAANARQIAGADIEAQIDRYYREADATRAGAIALDDYRRGLERVKIEEETRSKARDAFGDDAAAVEGQVARVLKAYDDLSLAKAQATSRAVDQTNDLAKSFDGVSSAVEGVGRRASRMLSDMTVGLDTANFSVARLFQTFASDVIGKIIQDKIAGPLAKVGGSFLDGAFGSLFGGGGGYDTPIVGLPTFGGRRAGGGDVEPGKAYLVGEHRAEMFVPDVRGRIIPEVRSVSGGMPSGAGGGVIVNVNDNRSERGSEPVRVASSRGPKGDAMIDVWISDKIDTQLKQKLSSGALDKPMGNAYGVTRKPFVRS